MLHERYQTWQEQGLFEKLFKKMVKYYAKERKIGWRWQAVNSMMSPAPLGGSQTGKNPTDRGKAGSKVHLLVDERGAPLAIFITGANEHDKWSADDLIVHSVAKRPNSIFVQTKATITKMFINLSDYKTILSTSSIGADATNRKRRASYPAKRAFQPDVGLLKELFLGW